MELGGQVGDGGAQQCAAIVIRRSVEYQVRAFLQKQMDCGGYPIQFLFGGWCQYPADLALNGSQGSGWPYHVSDIVRKRAITIMRQ